MLIVLVVQVFAKMFRKKWNLSFKFVIQFSDTKGNLFFSAFSRFHSFTIVCLVFRRDTPRLLATIDRSNKSKQSYLNYDLILSRTIINSKEGISLRDYWRIDLGWNRTREKRISEVFHQWCRKDLSSDEYHLQCGEE